MSERAAAIAEGVGRAKLRVAVPCPGVGRVRRGYERFSIDLAEALADHADVRVFAGRRPASLPGVTVPTPSRQLLAAAGMQDGAAYYWEQLAFTLGIWPLLWAFHPDVIHVSDVNVANALRRLKPVLPRRSRVLFSNGGGQSADHYRHHENVHLLGPWQLPEAGSDPIDEARVFVVPYGVFTSRFSPALGKAEARARLGLPGGLIAITLAAHVKAHKGVDYVIEELAHPEVADWSLVWLGQPTQETPAMEALAGRAAPGRVVFRTVEAERVPEYLAASDLLIFASHQEAFGLALVEGMAAGLPVVARDIPPFRYILDDAAQLSPMHRKGDLVPRFVDARSPEFRGRLGARNQRVAAERFDWKALVPEYLQMYSQVVRNPR